MNIAYYFIPQREHFEPRGRLFRATADIDTVRLGAPNERIINLILVNRVRFGITPYAIVASEDRRVFNALCDEVEEYANAVDDLVVVSIDDGKSGWGIGY